ncbi:uncharacterized, partial [Tachysurus ichikawai]
TCSQTVQMSVKLSDTLTVAGCPHLSLVMVAMVLITVATYMSQEWMQ